MLEKLNHPTPKQKLVWVAVSDKQWRIDRPRTNRGA